MKTKEIARVEMWRLWVRTGEGRMGGWDPDSVRPVLDLIESIPGIMKDRKLCMGNIDIRLILTDGSSQYCGLNLGTTPALVFRRSDCAFLDLTAKQLTDTREFLDSLDWNGDVEVK